MSEQPKTTVTVPLNDIRTGKTLLMRYEGEIESVSKEAGKTPMIVVNGLELELESEKLTMPPDSNPGSESVHDYLCQKRYPYTKEMLANVVALLGLNGFKVVAE